MPQIAPLPALEGPSADLLRAALMVSAPSGRNIEAFYDWIKNSFDQGQSRAMGLVEGDDLRGLAIYQFADEHNSYVRIMVLHMVPDAAETEGATFVHALFDQLTALPALEVIECGARHESPGVREALIQRGAVYFERCRMVRALNHLPEAALPDGYVLAQWGDEHQTQAGQIGMVAMEGSVDEVAVPEAQRSMIGEVLGQLRANEYPGIDAWIPEASFVLLNSAGRVIGYVATVTVGGMGWIADIAIHPDHQRRGLARLLMIRAMQVCQQQGMETMGLAVTTRNPARHLYEQLGFLADDCGSSAIWWRDGRQLAWR